MAERNVHFKGMSELSNFMQQLAPKMEANVMRAALATGARIVRDAAIEQCPDAEPSFKAKRLYGAKAGDLRQTIRSGSRVKQRKGQVVAYVRAGGKTKKLTYSVYWAHMVEYGTVPHTGGAYDPHPGTKGTNKPFMRPALDAESEHALSVIANFIKMRLETRHGLDTSAVVLGEET